MKNFNFKSTLFFVLMVSLVVTTSCGEFDGVDDEADLYGTWTIDETSADVTVGGVDIVTMMVTTMGMVEADAQAKVDSMMTDMLSSITGTITFNEDNTYEILVTGESADNGTWSVSTDGITLTMVEADMDSDNMTIVDLTKDSLILRMEAEEEDVDLDGDQEEETTMQFVLEIQLSK